MPYSKFSFVFVIVLLRLAVAVVGQGSTCSSSQPCAEGCCSKYGSCGFGPSFCGSGNCTSNCNAQSQCGQYAPAGQSMCPLNVCCSQYGFCGTTSDFCGTGCQNGCSPVTEPSCGGSSATTKTIGYYESWSAQRPCDVYTPANINPSLWTHLYYSFALINSNFQISTMNSYDPQFYAEFTGLKQLNPTLKTFISVGGWAAGGQIFSQMTSTAANRQAFIQSAINFMTTYGFDGIDIDWEYPSAPDRGGAPADKENYVSFLQELRAACGSAFGISATLPSSYWYMQGFDIVGMEQYVDWFMFLSYDIHGTWDGDNPYTQAVVNPHTNLTEISQGLDLLWRNSINPGKVVLGLAFYGRSFTLANPSCTTPGCAFSAGGNPGPCTQTSGILSNSEIQNIIQQYSLTPTVNTQAAVNWITWNNNQWVSYDDSNTYALKLAFASSKCLGGTMVWALDLDNQNTSSSLLNLQVSRLTQIGDNVSLNQRYAANKLQAMNVANNLDLITFWTACTASPQCPNGFRMLTTGSGATADVDPGPWSTSGMSCHGGPYGYSRALCIESNVQTGTCRWFGMPSGCGTSCPPSWILMGQNNWPAGSPVGCAAYQFSRFCCSDIFTSYTQIQSCPILYLDGALSGGYRSSPSDMTSNKYVNGIGPSGGYTYGVLPSIYGTSLECSSLLNAEEDPMNGPNPGFIPTQAGQIYLNRMPGMWQLNALSKQFYWNPAFNIPYPQPAQGATTCTITITSTLSTTRVSSISTRTCDANRYTQACWHYSSVISGNQADFEVLTCGTSSPPPGGRIAPAQWTANHATQWRYWISKFYAPNPQGQSTLASCQLDEYPPYNFPIGFLRQWIRFLPANQNQGAGQLWQGVCSYPVPTSTTTVTGGQIGLTCYETDYSTYYVNALYMTFTNMQNYPAYGVYTNPCYPLTLTADGGYALFTNDPWYTHVGQQYSNAASSYRVAPPAQLTNGYPDDIIVDTGNDTRHATPEELLETHGIVKCEVEGCAKELAALGLEPSDVDDPVAKNLAMTATSSSSATIETGAAGSGGTAQASRPQAFASYVKETAAPGHYIRSTA